MDKAASAGHSDRCRRASSIPYLRAFSPEVAANLDVDIRVFPSLSMARSARTTSGSSMSPKEFSDRMRAGARACPPGCVARSLYRVLYRVRQRGHAHGLPVLASALSSSYNSACQAADAVRAEYPNFELYVVDNALPCATGSCWRSRPSAAFGGTHRQAAGRMGNEAESDVHGYFTLESFDALAAGGRIPPAAAQLTAKLDVKPELSYDLAGSLSLIGVNRGRKKALESVKSFRENYVPDRTMPIAIIAADAGRRLARSRHPQGGGLRRRHHSQLRGSHHRSPLGPSMVACAFSGKNRADKASLIRPYRPPRARSVGKRCVQ